MQCSSFEKTFVNMRSMSCVTAWIYLLGNLRSSLHQILTIKAENWYRLHGMFFHILLRFLLNHLICTSCGATTLESVKNSKCVSNYPELENIDFFVLYISLSNRKHQKQNSIFILAPLNSVTGTQYICIFCQLSCCAMSA